MKEYLVVYELSVGDSRRLKERRFSCYHLADLFNSLNSYLRKFDEGQFVEVISIREI